MQAIYTYDSKPKVHIALINNNKVNEKVQTVKQQTTGAISTKNSVGERQKKNQGDKTNPNKPR